MEAKSREKLSYESLYVVYHTIFYSIGYSAIVMDCIIVFLIYNNTPKSMKIYSRFLLHSTIWELMTLIYLCILSRPILLYPLNCYVIEGPIKLLGYLSAWLVQVFVLVLYTQCVFALTACFIFRYQLTGSTGSQSIIWRPLFALALYFSAAYVVITVCVVHMYDASNDVAETLNEVLALRPEMATSLESRTLVAWRGDWNSRFDAVLYFVSLTSTVFCVVVFILILRRLHRLEATMTETLRRSHHSLTMGLLIQILTPPICIIVPTIINHFVQNDLINALCISAYVWYHIISASATLYFVKPYGRALIGYCGRFCGFFGLITIQTRTQSIQRVNGRC